MGNICSKSANKDDNFSTPGRVLGAAPQPARVPAQPNQKLTSSTPGRALGSAGSDGASSPNDARSAAARAAQVSREVAMATDMRGADVRQERAAAANKAGGKLSTSLAAQKKQTQNQTLNAGSEQERLLRSADANTETRNWN